MVGFAVNAGNRRRALAKSVASAVESEPNGSRDRCGQYQYERALVVRGELMFPAESMAW